MIASFSNQHHPNGRELGIDIPVAAEAVSSFLYLITMTSPSPF